MTFNELRSELSKIEKEELRALCASWPLTTAPTFHQVCELARKLYSQGYAPELIINIARLIAGLGVHPLAIPSVKDFQQLASALNACASQRHGYSRIGDLVSNVLNLTNNWPAAVLLEEVGLSWSSSPTYEACQTLLAYVSEYECQ